MNLLYIEKDSFIHRLHPACKIISLFILFIIALIFNSTLKNAIILISIVTLLFLCKGGKNLKDFSPFLFLLFSVTTIIWTFSIEGKTILFHIHRLNIFKESFLFGTSMGLRLNIMIISGLIFLTSTSIEEINYGLCYLSIPYSASFSISLAFRLVPIFLNFAKTTIDAQKLRGLEIDKGNIISRTKKSIPVIVPTFLNAINKSEMLSMALETKGFRAYKNRTFYKVYNWNKNDTLILTLLVLITIILIILKIYQ